MLAGSFLAVQNVNIFFLLHHPQKLSAMGEIICANAYVFVECIYIICVVSFESFLGLLKKKVILCDKSDSSFNFNCYCFLTLVYCGDIT